MLLLHCKTVGRERQEGENLWGKKRERGRREERLTTSGGAICSGLFPDILT